MRGHGFKDALRIVIGLLIGFSSVYFLIYPSITVYNLVREEASSPTDISNFAFNTHLNITSGFGDWAQDRVDSSSARDLSISDISGTEWPMFSAVYFLWSTEELDKAWVKSRRTDTPRPGVYAKEAVEAAAKLIVDPANASWVIKHWGDKYLDTENIFYRMLLIAGLTSYQSLSDNNQYEAVLKQQVLSLSRELDQSPYGVLDDYPGQCYPIDVLPAIAVIKRASELLNLDLGNFVQRARRGFEGKLLDPRTQLPSYIADPLKGAGIGPARGVGISYMLIWIKDLWPETAKNWFDLYDRQFVYQTAFASGVREFSRYSRETYSWLGDVDSGPIVGGLGVAASAFGIGAARVNGHVQLAHSLSTQAMLASWPLPSGRLLMPSLLSDLSDAPYLGETALLFVFSRPKGLQRSGGELDTPILIYLVLTITLSIGLLLLFLGLRPVFRIGTRLIRPDPR